MQRLGRRLIVGIAAPALAAPGLIGAGIGPAAAASDIPAQIFTVASALCMVPKGVVIRAGKPIVQVTCSSDLMQQWIREVVVTHKDGSHEIDRVPFWPNLTNGTKGEILQYTPGYCLGPGFGV